MSFQAFEVMERAEDIVTVGRLKLKKQVRLTRSFSPDRKRLQPDRNPQHHCRQFRLRNLCRRKSCTDDSLARR